MEGGVLDVLAKNAVRLASSESRLERVRYDGLSSREKEVFRHTAMNMSAKEIALMLDLGEKTIENARSFVMEKLGVHDRLDLYRYAVKIGVLDE